ncbi:MAG: DinB family protein [Planctomycetales bacterium]|nr:DinB family protein [bacterium]UNM07512.1 MAG: DinB family protein [Planctomycetales bacterium]
MYTPEALLDIMERVQHGNKNILEHCRRFSHDELHRRLPGFGFPSVQGQLFHMINAEQYWLMVLTGRFADGETFTEQEKYDWTIANFSDIDALEDYRQRVYAVTVDYISGMTPEELVRPREVFCDPGVKEVQIPVHVLMRVATHYFHHRGTLAAMCRTLEHPVPEAYAFLDYPLHEQPPFTEHQEQ